MIYIGIDGNVHSDELKHWKYVKKIKTGSGYRYFYSQAEIDAYYKEKTPTLNEHWNKLDKIDEKERQLKSKGRNKPDYYDKVRKLEKERDQAEKTFDNRKHYEREREEVKKAYRFAQKHPALHEIKIGSDLATQKAKNKVTKGKTKAEKLIKSETAGTKRAVNAVKGKGNNFYAPKDAKTYSKYDPKKKRFGKKKYKTGRIERGIINAYRKTHPYE